MLPNFQRSHSGTTCSANFSAHSLKMLWTFTFLLCGHSLAIAQENPLQYFTSDVDVLIRLKEPDQTLEKVVGLVNKIQPGAGNQIKDQQSALLGQLISNPTLTGVDQSRDWYAGVYTQNSAPPTVVFAIPALKTEDLVSALGADMTTSVKERWVLYTEADILPAAERSASAATRFGENGSKTFTSGDLNIYINIDHLSTIYAEQIELAQDKVLEGLNQLRFLPQQEGVNMQAVIEMYGSLAEAFFQGVEDGETSMAAISITDSEIVVNKQVTFAKDSGASKFLAENKTDSMPLLTKLPAGAPLYFGISGPVAKATQFSLKMGRSMFTDPEVIKKMEEQASALEKLNLGPVVGSIDFVESATDAMRVVGVGSIDSTDEFRKISRSSQEAMKLLENKMFKQTSTLQMDAETYGDVKGDVLTIKQEFNEELDPSGMQKKMQQLMFGDDGMVQRLVYLNGKYASTMGGGKAAMENLLKSLNADSSKTNLLEKARGQVMAKANMLLFLDLPKLVANVLLAASHVEEFPLPINAQMINTLNLKPSFISLAAGSEPNVLESEMRLPIDQIIGMTKLGVMIAGGMRGGL